jgi:MFS family permease
VRPRNVPDPTGPLPCRSPPSYGLTQIWGGRLSDRYGGSAVLAAGLLAWSAAAAATPIAAAHSLEALLACRAALGASQGVAFPAIHALLARGVPPERRSGAIGARRGGEGRVGGGCEPSCAPWLGMCSARGRAAATNRLWQYWPPPDALARRAIAPLPGAIMALAHCGTALAFGLSPALIEVRPPARRLPLP